MNDVICPHCNKKHSISIESSIPDKQKMSITLTAKSPFIDAEVVGKTIINTAKLLKAVAKEIDGKVSVFIHNITVIENEVKIEFIVAKVKKKAGLKK